MPIYVSNTHLLNGKKERKYSLSHIDPSYVSIIGGREEVNTEEAAKDIKLESGE